MKEFEPQFVTIIFPPQYADRIFALHKNNPHSLSFNFEVQSGQATIQFEDGETRQIEGGMVQAIATPEGLKAAQDAFPETDVFVGHSEGEIIFDGRKT